jgi:hypothetical protein
MVDILKDIETLENALIAFQEGASDEKYAAIWSLEKMLLDKKDQVSEFEKDLEDQFNNVPL